MSNPLGENIVEARIKILKQMNEYVLRCVNDEDIIRHWLTLGIPDCPDETDYESIAEDFDNFAYVCKIFYETIYIEMSSQYLQEWTKKHGNV